MHRFRSHGRAFAAVVFVAFLTGCAAPAPKVVAPAPVLPEKNPEALSHYATGVSLEAREGAPAALPEYEKAFELDPQNTALAGKLAQIYIAQKQREKALALLDKAIKANPKSPEPWFWTGVAHRAGEERSEAIATFSEALRLKPDYLPAIRALVEVYFQKDDANLVPPFLERAFSQTSDDASFWMGLGDLYQSVLKQKPSLSKQISSRHPVDCYEKAKQLSPRDPELLIRLAEAEMAVDNFTAAADAYSMLLKIRPDLTQLRERLAQAFLRADQKDKALGALKAILKREPLRYDVHNAVAELCQDLNKDADAALHFQQSLDINPNQFDVCVRLALVRLRQKRYDDALQILGIAKKKFPTRFQVLYLIGLVFSDQKNHQKAVAAYADAEQLIQTSNEDKPTSSFYFMYASACERAGQFDRAAKLFHKCLELDPKNHNAANYLGYMFADKNQNLTEALDLIQKAVTAQPDNPAYLDSLGWVYYRLGRDEDALKQLRRAVELSAKEPDATVFDHLADVLHKLNRRDEAIQALRKATQLEPQNKDLANKLKAWTAP
jgi:tetratricopeptide (TPR) repeat protein